MVACSDCEDYDLCMTCLVKDTHGHDPSHSFSLHHDREFCLKSLVLSRCKPGRHYQHAAICDGCEKVRPMLSVPMSTGNSANFSSVSPGYATSAWPARIGIIALTALGMPQIPIQSIALLPFMMRLRNHPGIMKSTMAFSAMAHCAKISLALPILLVSATNALCASTQTFARIARLCQPTRITVLIRLSCSRRLFAA